jgi:hypothetical protein
MSKFVTKTIEAIHGGRQRFEQLVILPDDTDLSKINVNQQVGIWEIYEQSLEDKYAGSFRGLQAIMDLVANLQSVPKDKFRDITPKKEAVKEFEFKYQDLRAYAIKIPNGKLVLLGGFKNNQADDITAFRALKRRYLDS